MLNSHHSENETTVTIVMMEFNMDLLLDSTDWTVTHARAVKSPTVFIKIISQYPRTFFLLGCFTTQKDTCKAGFLLFSQPSPTHAERLMSSFRLSSILTPCGPKGARNTRQ